MFEFRLPMYYIYMQIKCRHNHYKEDRFSHMFDVMEVRQTSVENVGGYKIYFKYEIFRNKLQVSRLCPVSLNFKEKFLLTLVRAMESKVV